jgi:Fe-S cluster assembly ATP-binding protein
LIGPSLGVLVITHYEQFLNYIRPEFVHIMYEGRIVEEGGFELAEKIQGQGYDWVAEKYAAV